MQQDISTLKKIYFSIDDRSISPPSSVKFGPRTVENHPEKVPHPLKLDGQNVLNR